MSSSRSIRFRAAVSYILFLYTEVCLVGELDALVDGL